MFLSKENLYRSTGKHVPIALPKKDSALSLPITMAILQECSQWIKLPYQVKYGTKVILISSTLKMEWSKLLPIKNTSLVALAPMDNALKLQRPLPKDYLCNSRLLMRWLHVMPYCTKSHFRQTTKKCFTIPMYSEPIVWLCSSIIVSTKNIVIVI